MFVELRRAIIYQGAFSILFLYSMFAVALNMKMSVIVILSTTLIITSFCKKSFDKIPEGITATINNKLIAFNGIYSAKDSNCSGSQKRKYCISIDGCSGKYECQDNISLYVTSKSAIKPGVYSITDSAFILIEYTHFSNKIAIYDSRKMESSATITILHKDSISAQGIFSGTIIPFDTTNTPVLIHGEFNVTIDNSSGLIK